MFVLTIKQAVGGVVNSGLGSRPTFVTKGNILYLTNTPYNLRGTRLEVFRGVKAKRATIVSFWKTDYRKIVLFQRELFKKR